ncbi:MAG: hypothetical protein IJZ57_04635 [Clostridia bacterium]|nr:hypothetical protein [Clostridia bacterium]
MKENKSDLKATIIMCVAAIVCVSLIMVTFSQGLSKLTDSNNAIAKLTEGSNNTSALKEAFDGSTDTYNSVSGDEVIAPDNDSVVSEPTDNSASSGSNPSATVPDTGDAENYAMTSVAEIVSYFNTSVNKIKPTAKKVVKNYEKRTFHEDKTDIPDAIESVAEGMVSSMMGDDTEPIVFATKEEIEANFIVPEQSYSSKLESSWVKSASCKDNEKEYVVSISLKDHKNPTAGNGVGAVCDVIETHEVANKVSFVEEFSTLYYNCEIVATIDKATGNVVHINYKTPLLLNMTVNLLGTHSGVIAFTFEKDYTITY